MVILSALGSQLNIILGVFGLILIMSLILKKINQPYIIAYILTGVVLGPSGYELVTNHEAAEILGEFGLIILMFFIGMEISLADFLKKWKVALTGTGLQVVFSILLAGIAGYFLHWSLTRIVLLGFIISLSSSAVVIKLLQDSKVEKTKIGQSVISILLTQDILIVPMIIIMSLLSAGKFDGKQILLQLTGGILITLFLTYLLKKRKTSFPFSSQLKNDHELQVFASLIICFGFAFLSSLFELSAGLGAFVAGLFVHSSPSTKWLHDSLHSFRVVLISMFFLSVGMLIDIDFFLKHWVTICFIVLGVYLSNHGINSILLKIMGNSWKESWYGASMLSQIGEFSFVLASLGYHAQVISNFSYQLTIIVISITILISPFWVMLAKKTARLEVDTLD